LERLQEEGFVLLGLRPSREADLQNAAVFRFEAAAVADRRPRGAAPPAAEEEASTSGSSRGAAVAAAAARNAAAKASPRGGVAAAAALKAELPFHRLMPGDMVSASPGDAPPPARAEKSDVLTGIVLERGPAWIKLAVSESAAMEIGGAADVATSSWRIDLAANAVAHERMVAALMRFAMPGAMPSRTGGGTGRSAAAAAGASASDDVKDAETTAATAASYSPLQRALLGGGAASLAAAAAPHWLPAGRAGVRAARAAADATTAGLNASQRDAVATALGRTLTLWQGPPGTGKTRTLLALIRAAVSQRGGTRGPVVLACAPSNVAVDNIVEGLLNAGGEGVSVPGLPRPLRVIRLGAPAKVAPSLRGVTLHASAAAHPSALTAASLRDQARAAGGGAASAALRHAAREAEAKAYTDTLANADVIAATCSGAGDDTLGDLLFPWVFVDEATQATEPASLVPLVRAHAAVLVGDAAQLPPTVIAVAAADGGLGRSMPERLAARPGAAAAAVNLAGAGLSPLLLDTQYRMHPALAAFPSMRFYGSRLLSGVSASERAPPRGFAWPAASVPLAFLDVRHGAEARTQHSGSVANAAEAAVLARALARLLAAGLDPSDVGVLTPYAGQVRAIQRALGASLPPDVASGVEVRTVDGFQGREKEVILFSAVRANAGRALGFTADARRLNVAITRAKRCVPRCARLCVVFCDASVS
jgi:regulator of nonsense transcripts 1